MAILQNDYSRRVKHVTVPRESGVVATARFEYTVSADIASGDIIEIGVLPAGAIPVDATIITGDLGAVTVDAGVMSGTVGSTDAARTCGAELFDGAAVNSVVRASAATAFGGVAASGEDRSIGVLPSGAVTASGQTVVLQVQYKV